jgi:hypothetical protein
VLDVDGASELAGSALTEPVDIFALFELFDGVESCGLSLVCNGKKLGAVVTSGTRRSVCYPACALERTY